MASINSLMSSSSSTSSIYGNSNIISGLASGMDTEAMIENAVSGLKNKIAGLNQDKTKLEWEQTAYRSIIDKLVNFSDKYLSFASNTNLLSTSFFNSAIKNTSSGTYKNLVSATGKTASDFQILGAKKAVNASYSGIAKFNLGDQTFSTSMTMEELGLIAADGKAELNLGDDSKKIEVSASDTVSTVLSRISKEMGIDATYSTTTGKFYLKSQTSGVDGNFKIDGGLAESLFGSAGTDKNKYTDGEDSYLKLSINNQEVVIDDQGSNTFNIDGMSITIKGNFEVAAGEEAVSFETVTDSDKIVDAIKSLVEDFNAMANEVKDAYNTKPLTQSNGKKYKPLTEEDAKDMSEDAIKKYEEKAKTGLLFADGDLSALYSELRSAISDIDLEAIGIKTAYASGKTTLVLDEEKLRATLESDPDKVKETLTKSKENGDSKDGVMVSLQNTINKYAKTTGATKGILIELAGSEKATASLNKNTYKDKMDRLQEQIERWQEKLSDKVDYYTRQFTALEKMISEMNSQSSALAGMMGY